MITVKDRFDIVRMINLGCGAGKTEGGREREIGIK